MRFFGSAVGLALSALMSVACTEPAPTTPPNILLITIDTLRADVLSCYGGTADVGKAICSLGESGMRFRWAFSTSPFTMPSMASVLTGQYPYAHGVRQAAGSTLRDEVVTVAERLHEAGYSTGAVVSTPVLSGVGLEQGFESYDVNMTRRERNRDAWEREAEATTAAAIDWTRAKRGEPWFLWLHYQDPHGPYDPPGRKLISDDPKHRRLRVLPNFSGLGGIPVYQALPGLFTLQAYEEMYREEVRYLDRHIGRFLAAVRAQGAMPAIILTADHGEAFGEDGYYMVHGQSVGMELVRVPLFYRPAQGMSARVIDAPVSLVDVAPLIVDLAGVQRPESFVGENVLASGQARRTPLFAQSESAAEIAVVQGNRYFAAGSPRTRAGPREARTRFSSLGDDDVLPGYETKSHKRERRKFASLVARYQASLRKAAPPPAPRAVSEERKKQLRALGYAE